jgi:hypothetical protein
MMENRLADGPVIFLNVPYNRVLSKLHSLYMSLNSQFQGFLGHV